MAWNLVRWKFPGIYEDDPSEDSQSWKIQNLLEPDKASSVGTESYSVELLAGGGV